MRFCASVNHVCCKLLISCSCFARNFATNPFACFFVSEWLIPLTYPLCNQSVLLFDRKVDISDIFSRILIPVYRYKHQSPDAQKCRSTFIYIDIFDNTLMLLHFSTNQNLFWVKKVNFAFVSNVEKGSGDIIHQIIANI